MIEKIQETIPIEDDAEDEREKILQEMDNDMKE